MIKTTQRRNKKYVTSSYFDDIRTLRRSKFDTDMRDLRRNYNFDVYRLQQAYVSQEIALWKRGCWELSDYVAKLPNDQLKDLETVYMGQDWAELKDETVETVQRIIADPDNPNSE